MENHNVVKYILLFEFIMKGQEMVLHSDELIRRMQAKQTAIPNKHDGRRNPSYGRKLSNQDVLKIKQCYKQGHTYKFLAKYYDVSVTTIARIIT
jgi:DNA invertase Pin-like site-specific DNA recombinase